MQAPDRLLPNFLCSRRCGLRVVCVEDDETLALLEALLPDPDAVFQEEDMVKPGSRTHAGFVTMCGKRYFLKRYNRRNWPYRVINALRGSRAARAWETTWAMWLNKVPVPRPLIMLEERQMRLLGRSYILMESLHDTERLVEAFDASDHAGRLELLEQAASTLAAMHAAGGVHGDLKWPNILVARTAVTEFYLVDLDGARVMHRLRRDLARKDLQRFVRDLAARDEGGEYVPFFWQRWEDELELAVQRGRIT